MVDRNAREKLTVISFKHRESRRHLLAAIQKERQHDSISDTLREAIDSYIENHLRTQRDPTENPTSLANAA